MPNAAPRTNGKKATRRKKYQPARGFRVSKREAVIIGGAVEEIQAANRGVVTPRMFVDYAKNNPESEAYELFDWNVRRSAEKHWETRASYLLRSYEIVIKRPKQEPKAYRALVSVEGEGYVSITVVTKSETLQEQYKRELLENLESFYEKYVRFCDLTETQVLGTEGKALVQQVKKTLRSHGVKT